jgi:hypothetical protein
MDDQGEEISGSDGAEAANPSVSGGGSPADPGADAVSHAEECSPIHCSAALETFLANCPPFPPFGEPWNWLVPAADCRLPPTDPAAILEILRRQFPDGVLRAAQLIDGPDATPIMHRSLSRNAGGYVIPVRGAAGGRIIDLLTPCGPLSAGDVPHYTLPILPASCESLPNPDVIYGTVDPRELVLLHTLGLPAVLLRRSRPTRPATLRSFTALNRTAVTGCRPPLNSPGATCTATTSPSSSLLSLFVVVLGCSFLVFPWTVPGRLRTAMRFVRFVRESLGIDLGECALVAAPRREHLDQLRQGLIWRDATIAREWFQDQALRRLVNWDEYQGWSFPEETFRSYDYVRRDIVALLASNSIWSSYRLTNLQRLHDEMVAAIDRDLAEPLFDRAAQADNVVAGLPARMLATTMRGWLIVEPYAATGDVPRGLRLGINLGGLTVREFHAAKGEQAQRLIRSNSRVWANWL